MELLIAALIFDDVFIYEMNSVKENNDSLCVRNRSPTTQFWPSLAYWMIVNNVTGMSMSTANTVNFRLVCFSETFHSTYSYQ